MLRICFEALIENLAFSLIGAKYSLGPISDYLQNCQFPDQSPDRPIVRQEHGLIFAETPDCPIWTFEVVIGTGQGKTVSRDYYQNRLKVYGRNVRENSRAMEITSNGDRDQSKSSNNQEIRLTIIILRTGSNPKAIKSSKHVKSSFNH